MTETQLSSEPNWLKRYPQGIPGKIDDRIARHTSILSALDESCAKFAQRPAFYCMGRSITYAELQQSAEAMAAFFQTELRLKKGDRIALQMPNVLQYPIALFGALKAGLIVVNTNPLYTEREMLHQFNDSGVVAVVILANFAHHLEKILSKTRIRHVITTEIGDQLAFPKGLVVNLVLRHVKKMVPAYHIPTAISFNEALARGARRTWEAVEMKMDDVAFLQYTGGTTGISKGAMLTHRNIVANMEQLSTWISPIANDSGEIAICALPLYHIFAFTVNGLTIPKIGGMNILITNPRDIPGFVKEISKHKFTIFTGVNTLYNALLNNSDFRALNFSTLKAGIAGGMALQKAVAMRWKEVTGTTLIEGYGLTETSPVASANPLDGTDRVGTIGLPMPSTSFKIISEEGKELNVGDVGEICIRGPQVMPGYWNRPEETANVLTSDGWLRTGDIGVIDEDGFTKIVDRKKDMILVSGFNVYPNEVEDVIAAHPGVLECAAVGIPDDKSGEVVKIFVVKKEATLTEESLIAFARENLVAYKVPKHVEFRKELPKTNVGKILRRALRASGT